MSNYQIKSNGVEKSNTIENLFITWGKTQHQLPINNQELKAKMLAKFSVSIKSQTISGKKFNPAWFSFAFLGLAVITLFITSSPKIKKFNQSITLAPSPTLVSEPPDSLARKDSAPLLQSANKAVIDEYTYQPEATPSYGIKPPVTDNREFLKTDYSATVQSTHVQEITTQLQTAVKGFDGRIDSSNSTPEFSRLSFVIPADKFENFRAQIKNLVGTRFIIEQSQTENLLPQKKGIENQQQQTGESLNQITNQLDQLTQNHNLAVKSFNNQINTQQKQLQELERQIAYSPEQAAQIEAQKQEIQNKIKILKNQLTTENNSYSAQASYLNSQIQSYQAQLENLNKETNNLLDTVATVQGTITVNHINFLQALNIYLNGYLLPLIFVALAITVYFISRWRSQLIIP